MKYNNFFRHRKNTFEKSHELILNNIDNNKTYNIVELGTTRSFLSGKIVNDVSYYNSSNIQSLPWSDGMFTKTFVDNLEEYNVKLYTIDPCPNAIKVVSTIIGNNSKVEIIQKTSIEFLNNIDFKIDFLYMDYMESSFAACKQHLEDSKLIIEKNLMSENSLILIDNCPINGKIHNTKGALSFPYLINNGYKNIIHEYPALLIKDNNL